MLSTTEYNINTLTSIDNIKIIDKLNTDKSNKDQSKNKINRCDVCNKKVGLLGFQCKCDKIKLFCSIHKNPEDHNCNFDYKKDFKNLLEKKNPKIISNKIDKL